LGQNVKKFMVHKSEDSCKVMFWAFATNDEHKFGYLKRARAVKTANALVFSKWKRIVDKKSAVKEKPKPVRNGESPPWSEDEIERERE
jgi:hypothetical protein